MKHSSGKLQFWKRESPLSVPENFSLAHSGVVHSSMPEMSEEDLIFLYFVLYEYRTGSILLWTGVWPFPAHNLSFFHRVNLRKIPEMSSSMEECKIHHGRETKCSPTLPLVLAPSGQGGRILLKFLLQCRCSLILYADGRGGGEAQIKTRKSVGLYVQNSQGKPPLRTIDK